MSEIRHQNIQVPLAAAVILLVISPSTWIIIIFNEMRPDHNTGISMPYSLTVIPWARMGSESVAHETEGQMGYWLGAHQGERNNNDLLF